MRHFALIALSALLSTSSADAVNSCRIRAVRSTGVILVDAKGVTGSLLWGPEFGAENQAFANVGECLSGGIADDCTLGVPGTPEEITPPPLCSVFLADDASTCEARLRNCTPGLRSGTLLTLADLAAGTVAGAFDDDGQPIGNVVNTENNAATVALSIGGRNFTVEVGRDRFFGMKSFTGLYVGSADCAGPTYVKYSPGVLPVVFVGEDNVAWVENPDAVPTLITFASQRHETGGCTNLGGTEMLIPASPVVNLFDFFTPPFAVR